MGKGRVHLICYFPRATSLHHRYGIPRHWSGAILGTLEQQGKDNVGDDSGCTLFPVCRLLYINSFNWVP